ncbi:hypothetical protein [Luteolibacter sp. LG18]|uniref:hypothetical protein n=1 Tax=Luteolibacter sp. LG18 TaxID=2819286 RepID=UPI002B2ACEA2|nr:hypothetical protein llg_41380 [Luteolibacter sp. LG18]
MQSFPGPLVDDNREKETIELVQNLTLKGDSLFGIREQLKAKGLENQLPQSDIERIYHQARAGREIGSRRPGMKLPRIVGIIAVLSGVGWGVATHFAGSRPYLAIILGLTLIFKPQSAGDEV